jgi:hypothetical protein
MDEVGLFWGDSVYFWNLLLRLNDIFGMVEQRFLRSMDFLPIGLRLSCKTGSVLLERSIALREEGVRLRDLFNLLSWMIFAICANLSSRCFCYSFICFSSLLVSLFVSLGWSLKQFLPIL